MGVELSYEPLFFLSAQRLFIASDNLYLPKMSLGPELLEFDGTVFDQEVDGQGASVVATAIRA
jgi:hypothetical protein